MTASESRRDEKRHEVALPLLFDRAAKTDLVSVIREVADGLESSPFARPVYNHVSFGRIPLKTPGKRDPLGRLFVHYLEHEDGADDAMITMRQPGDIAHYHLAPTAKDWEIVDESDDIPVGVISNTDLVVLLDQSIHKKDVMKPLLDQTEFDPMDIPRLLSDQLLRSASMRRTIIAYKALFGDRPDVDTTGDTAEKTPPFNNSVLARLAVHNFNGAMQYFFSVEAPVVIGERTIHKKYSFEFEIGAKLYPAIGQVVLSAAKDVPKIDLKRFAELDQEDVIQAESLERAATMLLIQQFSPPAAT